jgi:aminoglycoside 6'-N-acetyltransferase
MKIILRLATIEDLPIIKYWDTKPHVIFATGSDSYIEDDWVKEQLFNPSSFVWLYIAELGGRAIGFVQIIDPANEETHYWGDIEQDVKAIDIWIGEEDDLGKGYGTEMIKIAITNCFMCPRIKAILIDPLEKNTRAIKFYKKLGFQFVENKFFGQDFCTILKLNRSEFYSKAIQNL